MVGRASGAGCALALRSGGAFAAAGSGACAAGNPLTCAPATVGPRDSGLSASSCTYHHLPHHAHLPTYHTRTAHYTLLPHTHYTLPLPLHTLRTHAPAPHRTPLPPRLHCTHHAHLTPASRATRALYTRTPATLCTLHLVVHYTTCRLPVREKNDVDAPRVFAPLVIILCRMFNERDRRRLAATFSRDMTTIGAASSVTFYNPRIL